MSEASQSGVVRKGWAYWTGWVLSVAPCLLLIFSGIMKLVQPAGMAEQVAPLGWKLETLFVIGVVELACTALYLIPFTSIFGAILLTGYLGGAIATHVRIGQGPDEFGMIVVIGVILWLGLFLREPRLRVLIPFRR